ncbi:MAG: putative glycolipid-binding domain-containing protein [Alkalibacterium sp.]|nr:putative glycolipid-binding domain-containing protein [Alkalibacterium sp.]
MKSAVVWTNVENGGCEHLAIKETDNQMFVQSTLISIDEKEHTAYTTQYTVEMDKNWSIKTVQIDVNDSNHMGLSTDGLGNWFNLDGQPLPHLKGAIDIDISATPFSNSLPINRLNWKLGQIEAFQMVYISVPSLAFKRVDQTYQFIRQEEDMRYFKYHSTTYDTVISVDSDGLVLNYPELFKRLV